jgi:hypothetical protein
MVQQHNPHQPGIAPIHKPDQTQKVQQGSRIRTRAGEIGRVHRLDPDESIAYVQLDANPSPDDGTAIDINDLELIAPE